MSKRLTNERGFLNYDGELQGTMLREQIKGILLTQTDEIHMRSLGCALKALVSEEISMAMLKVKGVR